MLRPEILPNFATKPAGTSTVALEDICPTLCDDDCEVLCHEEHEVTAKRFHRPEDCPSARFRR